MSLVAYGSSDDSDPEEGAAGDARRSGGGLFSPAAPHSRTEPAGDSSSRDGLHAKPSIGGIFSSLPKPRKRSEPVRIPVPHVHKHDSDSDEDEPSRKKMQPQGSGAGLSSILPQPKNLTVKEVDRPLIPHALTKRQEPKGARAGGPAQGLLAASASPSAIKAAAKSAALQVARQIATDDQDHDEDIAPQNYFSLEDSSEPLTAAAPAQEPEPGTPSEALPYAFAEEPGQSDAPLDFGGSQEAASAWAGQYQPMARAEDFPQGYYGEPYYQEQNPGQEEEPEQSDMFDDEGFMRLQGKRNRGKEEIKFLEIKGDDQLSGNKQWMTKGISEEKQSRQSFSKKRGGMPTGQQRRKHQITYLIHQAKERELELKNSWAENRLTRRQTQAKYGF